VPVRASRGRSRTSAAGPARRARDRARRLALGRAARPRRGPAPARRRVRGRRARASAPRRARTLLAHVLPNALGPAIVAASFAVGAGALVEAGPRLPRPRGPASRSRRGARS
jgi:hypothetical protein